MILTDADLALYFKGTKKSPIYEEAVKHYNKLRIHADGEYPKELIDERRPHESDYVQAYRKKIYQPITKETVNSPIQSTSKIRRSTDWSIKYSADVPAKIKEGESLEDYCEKKFPYYSSLTNWVFSVLHKNYFVDPNAVVLVMPMNAPKDNEYLKPYPIIFNSPNVLDYREGEFAILSYGKTEKKQKEQWYVVTTDEILVYEKSKDKYVPVSEYKHNLGYVPVVKIRAVFKESIERYSLFESRLSTMLPRLDEAVREYSDQQANIVNHLFPERWEFATQPCDGCMDSGNSIGKIRVETTKGEKKTYKMQDCAKCGGSGLITTAGPYKKFIVRGAKENMGEQPTPLPPFGYVQKDTAIIEAVDKRIEFHQYKALCSINMQFLMQTPLNQSGLAKEVDRDELNNFVYSCAEDIVCVMDGIYKVICDYRYQLIMPNETERHAMLPDVAVPEKYDILSSTYLADEVKAARESKLSGVITSALELEYCSKKFYNNPEIRDEMSCVIQLDPMVGASEEDKMVRLQNDGATNEDYVLSCNIVPFVKRAIMKEKDFTSKTYEEKMEIIRGFAQEVIAAKKATVIPPNPQGGA